MTDVIAFRKYSRETLDKIAELREQSPQSLIDANVQWQPFIWGPILRWRRKALCAGRFRSERPNKFRDVDRVITQTSEKSLAGVHHCMGRATRGAGLLRGDQRPLSEGPDANSQGKNFERVSVTPATTW